MNGSSGAAIGVGIASPSDVLCLEVATHLVEVLDGVPMAPDSTGPAEWSVSAADGSGRTRQVEIARVPFEREALERRRTVLARADVVMLVADATLDTMPIVEAALAEVRSGSSETTGPLVVFGIGPSAGGGPDAEAIADALGVRSGDVVVAAGSSDRDALREAFALALRSAGMSGGSSTSTPPVAPAAPEATPAPPAAPPPTSMAGPPAAVADGNEAPAAPVAPYGVELNPDLAATGSVEITASVWAALAELVGGIDPAGDPRRTLLVSGLLAHGIVAERHELAGEDALWLQPVVAPSAMAATADERAGEFRQLKGLRQNVVG